MAKNDRQTFQANDIAEFHKYFRFYQSSRNTISVTTVSINKLFILRLFKVIFISPEVTHGHVSYFLNILN